MSGHRGWTSQDDEDLLHLADSGVSIESIAWALDRSPGTVRVRLAILQQEISLEDSVPDPAIVSDLR